VFLLVLQVRLHHLNILCKFSVVASFCGILLVIIFLKKLVHLIWSSDAKDLTVFLSAVSTFGGGGVFVVPTPESPACWQRKFQINIRPRTLSCAKWCSPLVWSRRQPGIWTRDYISCAWTYSGISGPPRLQWLYFWGPINQRPHFSSRACLFSIALSDIVEFEELAPTLYFSYDFWMFFGGKDRGFKSTFLPISISY
jgi:hypothetical protein